MITDPLLLHTLHPWLLLTSLLLGASIGSFLNVVIYRVPRGMSVANPRRSFCPYCRTQIAWYDNVPVLSFLALRARCRRCGAPISPRYMLVELCTAILFAAIFQRYGATADTAAMWIFVSVLIALTFIDLNHYLLPEVLTYPTALVGVALSPFVSTVTFTASLIGALAGWLIIFGIARLWLLLTRKEGMGMGDAGLLALIGAFLGYGSLAFVLFFASVQGLVAGVVLLFMGKLHTPEELDRFDPQHESYQGDATQPVVAEPLVQPGQSRLRNRAVPFGPFLVLAALQYALLGNYLVHWYYDLVTGIARMLVD